MSEISPILQKVLLLSGLPASGKSGYAETWVAEDPRKRVEINYDSLRLQMFGPGHRFNRADEDKMKAQALTLFEIALSDKKDVIVSNTSLTRGARQRWIDAAKKHSVEVELMEINPGIDVCIERDRTRTDGKRVGEAVISRMALFTGFYDWKVILGGRMAVVFDVDGTLADTSHRAHFVNGSIGKCRKCGEWFKCEAELSTCTNKGCDGRILSREKDWRSFFRDCHLDPPIEPIVNLAKDFKALNYEIIVVSGRPDDECGIKTEDWLRQHEVPYDHLFMRKGGDFREDTIIKKEILELLPKKDIAFVVDDRDSVVAMWRNEGLTCLQAAKGDF